MGNGFALTFDSDLGEECGDEMVCYGRWIGGGEFGGGRSGGSGSTRRNEFRFWICRVENDVVEEEGAS